jgi:hypothetical protein
MDELKRDEAMVLLFFAGVIAIIACIICLKTEKAEERKQKKNEYISETFFDTKDNKNYKIIKDNFYDVIFCEEIKQEEEK